MLCLQQLIVLVLALAHSGLSEVLYVDSSVSETVWPCGKVSSPCPSLEAAMKDLETIESVSIQVLSSTLTLNGTLEWLNKTDFHLRGSNNTGTLITCSNTSENNAGLVLQRVENVTVSAVHFSGCGTLRIYEGRARYHYMAVIHLVQCEYVTITGVNVTNSHGTGVAIIDPWSGNTSISHSRFGHNHIPAEYRNDRIGGSGVGVYLRGVKSVNKAVRFYVSHCTFEHNRRSSVKFNATVFNPAERGSGKGGGLGFSVWYNTSWNFVNITDCVFRNNTAHDGGGLAVLLSDDSSHNHINVTRCVFERNGCGEGGVETESGGGAYFGYISRRNITYRPQDNGFIVKDSVFRENCAQLGGGMTFTACRTNEIETSMSNTFLLDNCSWVENMAHVGAAVDVSPGEWDRTKMGFLPKLVVKDCNFNGNHNKLDRNQSFGSGVLFSSLVNVDFLGEVHFRDNNGSALVIVNAISDFTESDAVFEGNTGVQGGAISLTGISALVVGPGKTYNFTNNHATDRGGAIYNYLIDDHDFTASQSCFLYYSENDVSASDWEARFNFTGNTAGTYGHSIFSSSILSCVQMGDLDGDDTTWNTTQVFRWPEVFEFDSRTENQIATEGGSFLYDSLSLDIVPGEEHQLGVKMTDDNGQEIEVAFRTSMINTTKGTVEVNEESSCLSGNVIRLRGGTGSSGVLRLETVSSRKNCIAVNVTLLPCPPGFVLSGDECTCSKEMYPAIVECDMRSFQSSIKVGYWAGYIENDTFVTSLCPLSFCAYNSTSYKTEIPLPKVTSAGHLDEYICGPTRTGVLCTSCKPGYSVSYHSPSYRCLENSGYCEFGWLLYILTELLPVTLTFTAILALNVSFTSGSVSGFILFSHLLDSTIVSGSVVIQCDTTSLLSSLAWGYQLIYGIFTMEFFNIEPLSFCLWEGATVMDVLAFRYVTFVYAFLLVLVTLLFLKYCGNVFAKKYLRITTIKTSVIHGLSAFIVLCYAQVTKVSLYILIPGYMRGKNGRILKTKALLSGDAGYFGPEHLVYALPALFCLLTICALPPALLIFYPSVNKLLAVCNMSDKRLVVKVSRVVPINKLKPFLDSFQGCFKDNLRFFAGIYFLYRWITPLLFATMPTSAVYMTLGNAYILVLVVHAVFQPYTSRVYNIVDGCLFANLALIYSFAGYNYLFSHGLIEPFLIQIMYVNATVSIQLFLIYLPILALAVYACVVICRRIRLRRKISTPSVAEPLKCSVTSTDIQQLLNDSDGFPARLLEADYEKYSETSEKVRETTLASLGLLNTHTAITVTLTLFYCIVHRLYKIGQE